MWYLRGVENYNIWKKSEFYSRKYFIIDNDAVDRFHRFSEKEESIIETNRKFIEQYI